MPNPITHWTQFDQLYNLTDPRPYFRGVQTGDYRMPGVLASIIRRLLPVLAARAARQRGSGGPVHLIDFASGYGTVGLCLRHALTMAHLYDYFQQNAGRAQDISYFADLQKAELPDHRIDGIDIADVALSYAMSVGALDAGHAANVLNGPLPADLVEAIGQADLIYECGAIGDLITPAVDAILSASDPARRPWLLLCPRPRVAIAPIEQALARHGYTLSTLIAGVRYRKPFSESELAEEMTVGIGHGLSIDDCTVNGYFRVDVRLAVPVGESCRPAQAALRDLVPELI